MSASVTMSMIMDCMLLRYISKVVPSMTSMAWYRPQFLGSFRSRRIWMGHMPLYSSSTRSG